MKKPLLLTALAVFGLTLVVGAGNPTPLAPDLTVAGAQDPKPTDKPPAKDEPKKDEKAAVAEIGKAAPEFSLTDLEGKTVKLSAFKGKIVVLEWFSPVCPACVYAYSEGGPLREWPERLKKDGIVYLVVNSSNPDNDGSKLDLNKKFLEENKAKVQVLLDPTGATGKAYGAKTTPHMFVIDEDGTLLYAGAIDDDPRGGGAKTNYVESALSALAAGEAPDPASTRPYGCSIKY